MRSDISKPDKKNIADLLQKESEKLKEIDKTKLGRMFYKGVMAEFYIHRYIQNFRARKRERDRIKMKEMKQKLDENVLQINDNERLVFFLIN